jgi:hypothetical protein
VVTRLQVSALVLASLLAGWPSVRAQSLADVARQEEERRKHIKTEAKVYTNKDLGNAPPAPASPRPAPAASDTTGTKDGAAKTDAADSGAKTEAAASPAAETPKRDQAYWNGRLTDLQTTLERDRTYLEALQSRINALTTDFVNRDDPAQRAVIATDRDRAIAEFERLKKQNEDHRKAIADFEEEARRAGVPPGWLR